MSEKALQKTGVSVRFGERARGVIVGLGPRLAEEQGRVYVWLEIP